VKIDTLCGRLGVTKGSFYWHFEDLRSFLAAVAERWGEERDKRQATFAQLAELEPQERLAQMLELLADTNEWRLERAVREWARTDEGVRARVAQSDRWIYRAIRQAFLDLGLDREQADIRATGLFYAGVGWVFVERPAAPGTKHQRELLLEVFTS
jgi:AcrR family transcriptional regulator